MKIEKVLKYDISNELEAKILSEADKKRIAARKPDRCLAPVNRAK